MAMDSASDVLEDALNFPMSDDDWVVTVLVGGLMALGGVLLVPVFILQGYFVTVIRETLAGEDLPEWGDTDWGDMLTDGLKLTVVNLAYSIVLVLPLFLLFAVGALGSAAAGEGSGAGAALGIGALVIVALWFFLVLVVSYILPAAIVNFARHESVRAAFDFDTIRDVVTDRDYVVGFLLAIAVNVIASFVIGIVVVFGLITFGLGLILLPWISFFFNVMYFYVFAQAYAGALDLDIPLRDVAPAEA